MINRTRALDELEAAYQRQAYQDLTFDAALARFAALWAQARALNPEIGQDWRSDLEADLAVARAVNGLPPGS